MERPHPRVTADVVEASRRLRRALEAAAARVEGPLAGEVKASVHHIPAGIAASVKGDRTGWAASIIKLPVLAAAVREMEQGRLDPDEGLPIDHRFVLDPTDLVSRLPAGSRVTVAELLDHMIVLSDNEATNVLADRIGIGRVNEVARDLGLRRTMLGHLLCRGVPRHAAPFNPDGSNITCPDDMTALLRHFADPAFSALSGGERRRALDVLSRTRATFLGSGRFGGLPVMAKIGLITDPVAGDDIHEVGIVAGVLIVSVMLNRIGRARSPALGPRDAFSAIIDAIAGSLPAGALPDAT